MEFYLFKINKYIIINGNIIIPSSKMNFSLILPTYNESKNIKKLIPEIRKEFSECEIIVVDDNSPDGTAKTAESLGVKVILRKNKEGIGAALKAGYIAAKHNIIISMDADCSIAVKDIYKLIEKLNFNDLVVGSKYSKGSQAKGFKSKKQMILSYLGNQFFITFFQLPVDDVTLNFRAFRKSIFNRLNLSEKTNVFLLEMIIEAKYRKMKIGQVPIIFSERYYGKSKTNLKVLFPLYFKFFIKQIFGKFFSKKKKFSH
ncbi:MAG: glycosyltransferase [Crocosphaera sp.]